MESCAAADESREFTCEACTVDIKNSVVGYQEPLLPSHEDGSAITVTHRQMRLPEFTLDMAECWEARPMNHVFVFISSPVLCQKAIPAADYFGIKVRGELWPIVC